MLGAQIGQYRILDVVGGGGMGIVFRARQEMVDRDVALKLLPPELAHDEINSKRLEREAKALAKLNHPNIVTTFDFGLTPSGQAYLVMELVDGESLKELLLRDGRMELNRAIKIFVQMADAMRFAHRSGIVHRDLKPHNVMIAQAPSPDFVKVLDFGIARLADSQKLTRVGEIIGSPLYMSPEQCLSEPVDERTDIYALGVLMYVCITGHVPFKGETLYETVERKCTMPPPRFSEIAPELEIPSFVEELIRHCLAVEKEDRIQTMNEVKDLLESIASSQKKKTQVVSESTAVLNGPVAVPKRPAPPPKTIRERMQESSASKTGVESGAVPPKLPRSTVSRGSASRPAHSRPVSEAKGIVITPGVMALAVISLLACMLGGMYVGISVMDQDGTLFSKTTVKSVTASGASSPKQPSPPGVAKQTTEPVKKVPIEPSATETVGIPSMSTGQVKLVTDTHTVPSVPEVHLTPPVSKSVTSHSVSESKPKLKDKPHKPVVKKTPPVAHSHQVTPTIRSETGIEVRHGGGIADDQVWNKFKSKYSD